MTILKHVDFEVPAWGEFAQGPQSWSSYAQAVNTLNPIGFWRLGEDAGITAADATGTYDGTYHPHSGGTWTGGTFGVSGPLYRTDDTAAAFGDAPIGWVDLPFIALPSAFTIVAWVKLNASVSGPANTVFSWGEDQFQGHGVIFDLKNVAGNQAVLRFLIKDGSGVELVEGTTDLHDGHWHQVVVTHDGSNNDIYADGALEASQSFSFAPTLHRTSIGLFRRDAADRDNPINGAIDDLALFDHVLTPDAIADLHRRGIGSFTPAA